MHKLLQYIFTHLYALLQGVMFLLQALLLSFPLAAPPLLVPLCCLDVSSNSFLLLLQGQQPSMGCCSCLVSRPLCFLASLSPE